MKLTETELMAVKGGAFGLKTAIIVGVGGLITLLVGIIDGYINPLKCNMGRR